jgi:hypothetical protein
MTRRFVFLWCGSPYWPLISRHLRPLRLRVFPMYELRSIGIENGVCRTYWENATVRQWYGTPSRCMRLEHFGKTLRPSLSILTARSAM